MDRDQLADFLRTRREALQPEDVGLPRGRRRRTGGLRREEVAALCGMSADYYSRIEQHRGSRPSEPMLAAIARGLHLSLDERDHLFRLAGYPTPARELRMEHVDTGLMRVLDRLQDTPAQVVTSLGETLLQTPPAVALLGDETGYTGLDRSMFHRWFTRPETRRIYPREDHDAHSRAFTADLRSLAARHGPASRAADLARGLLDTSPEFARLWSEHEITAERGHLKRVRTAELGVIEVYCQMLFDLDQDQALLIFTATPGSESHEKLQLLSVIGAQQLPTRP
ncbi:helix-turn-helix transcriptional regulator [Streptomyces sp. NBC_01317]|uniref:helix-turn-helix transcriptional regulator n=1 Tax=Streptomyces sp. NBC_01317 TaxID=2903822 RepID=UPI002E160F41|nr:helix-turn-helix transcriptional regulator [Streptomyces sp. NBC_01317]